MIASTLRTLIARLRRPRVEPDSAFLARLTAEAAREFGPRRLPTRYTRKLRAAK